MQKSTLHSRYFDICCRGDIEMRHERAMRLLILRKFLQSYFLTENIITTSVTSIRSLLKRLSSEGHLCIHPAHNMKILAKTRAIMCVDPYAAGLIRHDKLYLYWQISDLVKIREEALLVTISDKPLTLTHRTAAAKQEPSLLRRIQQYADTTNRF